MDVVELAGRLLFAAVFLISPAGVLAQAPRVAGLPALAALPRPLAVAAVRGTCLAAMGGAGLIALGLWPDAGALLVLAFLVPVTSTMHPFWTVEPSLARKQKRDAFLTNTSLAGAALLLLAAVNQSQHVALGLLAHPLLGRA
ncbi:DoxX family protein [Baekduia soli]|uniref:DoxX family protein n=1 Tax=Baekduia soli TaxID=496014 RepID=A0A5B8UAZ8_9ACTN|nr:DoxX family protein [Baekduia soli]QEC50389.1 DoxX family protein [Baekduia soli]